mmetsp:Transcript_60253/g.141947  ORF Transcript_60253/g.141947 Transcript_60253/m.141947 type:complete len:337 (+) Transcript_60253:51-1061(+)
MAEPKPRTFKRVCFKLLETCIFASMGVIDNALRIIGPFFVLFAVTLISGVIWAWFKYILDTVADPGTPMRYVHITIACTLIFNVAWNYFRTVFVSPGQTPDEYDQNDIETGVVSKLDPGKFWDGFGRFCKKCRKPKPPRAHHCSICRKCVLKMDHHCPWVATCVGHRNYRTFYLFMFWLWTGCVYVMCTMGPAFLSNLHRKRGQRENGAVVFSFILAFSVSIAVGLLLSWHTYLIATAQTTIEWYNNHMFKQEARKRGTKWVNQWDIGIIANFALVLSTGDKPKNFIFWFLPSLDPPQGDGLSFPLRGHVLKEEEVPMAPLDLQPSNPMVVEGRTE